MTYTYQIYCSIYWIIRFVFCSNLKVLVLLVSLSLLLVYTFLYKMLVFVEVVL